jgi:hypothetical protein
MRHTFLIFGFAIIFSTFAYGQDNRIIYSKQVSNATVRSNEILQRSEAYISVDFVEIDLEKILHYEQLVLQFGEKSFLINKERIEVRGINNFCFIGKDSMYSRILLSVLDGDILGSIETLNGVYIVETIGENDYAIIKLDQSKIKDCGGTEEDDDDYKNEEGYVEDDTSNIDYDNNNFNWENNDTLTSSILRSAGTRDCKIRILVLYTPYAQSIEYNIKNTINHAINLANDAFIRSNINYQIELAYAGLTNYTETGYAASDFRQSLRRFRNDGDGYMDEVHTLRNKYSADICVLFSFNNDLCGRATGINVNANRSFCIVDVSSGCISKHSFIHEIGHLIGCRHDYGMDANLVPHTYCHGYINPSKTWRTIMAYGDKCNGCERKGFWSNPNVYYNGESTGTSYLCNNARVWNEHSDNVMTFRQPANNVIFTSSDYTNGTYGDVVAKQTITTSGTVNVASGSTLHMTAGNSIKLLPGFKAEYGSEFSAKIENITDCGSKGSTQKVLIQTVQEEGDEILEINKIDNRKFDFSYKVYPNPSNEFINIQYYLDAEIQLSIELVNMLGQRIKTILPKQKQQTGTDRKSVV